MVVGTVAVVGARAMAAAAAVKGWTWGPAHVDVPGKQAVPSESPSQHLLSMRVRPRSFSLLLDIPVVVFVFDEDRRHPVA